MNTILMPVFGILAVLYFMKRRSRLASETEE
jgi:hypothetical protein